MDKVQILDRLRAEAAALQKRGVEAMGLYGSVARGDNRLDSDVDLLLSLRPHSLSLFDLVQLQLDLERLLNRRVDLTTTPLSNPFLTKEIERDLIDVF
jgi:uncharacterized protein